MSTTRAEASGGGPIRPVLLSLANGGLVRGWDAREQGAWQMGQGREDVIRFYAERNGYREEEIMPTTPEPEADDDEPSMVPFAFNIGDKVWMADAPGGPAGRVVRLMVDPGESMYVVTWADTRCTTTHYDFELAAEQPM